MRSLPITLLLCCLTVGCSDDDETPAAVDEDTGAVVEDTMMAAETIETDSMTTETSTSDADPGDAPATDAPASETATDAPASETASDAPVACNAITCTTDAPCAALGCGTCRMSGKCGN